MTDVKRIGRRAGQRGVPLALGAGAFERIAAGRNDLQHADGNPNLTRIAHAAGLNRQRLAEVSSGARPVAGIYTLGALVAAYRRIHGVTTAQALAAVLDIPDDEPHIAPETARAA
jgi:hypothetical protein